MTGKRRRIWRLVLGGGDLQGVGAGARKDGKGVELKGRAVQAHHRGRWHGDWKEQRKG